MSLASAQAAEARRQASSTLGYYNVKMGPTGWRFGAGLGLQFDDNVNLSGTNSDSDFIVSPQINAQMLWPVTDKNRIDLSVGLGYSAYAQHSDLDRFYITPGSELSFDLYIGDFWVNLHERLSITQNAYEDPTVTGTGKYSQLQNTVGTLGTWDLNKVVLKIGYDHVNYVVLEGKGGQPDGQSEVFSSSAGYAFSPGTVLGLELGGSLLQHEATTNNAFSNAKQWNVGCFCDMPVTEYIHLQGSVGYTVYSPEASGGGSNPGDFTGIYAQIELRHKLNQYLNYTLSGGRSINYAFFGGTVDLYSARFAADWKIMRKVSIHSSFDYEHGSQIASGAETFDRYGLGLGLSRTMTERLTASLSYQFYWRGSDQPGRDYTANIVSLNLGYRF